MPLMGIEEVEAAMARHLRIDQYDWAQKRLGIDVARFGGDRNVIFPRQGLASFKPIVLRPTRELGPLRGPGEQGLGRQSAVGQRGSSFFDATGGWAAGTVDVLRAQGFAPIDVQFSAPAMDPRYRNRRAEIWFAMASG